MKPTEPEPQPLPETDPRRIAWVARIMSRQLNPDGSPLPGIRQTERTPETYDRPFVRRDR